MAWMHHRQQSFDDWSLVYVHHTKPTYIRPPRYVRHQITVGPFMPASRGADGSTTLPTPHGEFDLATALSPMGKAFAPDVVVVWADATLSTLPRNLARLPGRKVLMVGDTHHLVRPLSNLIRYACAEPFDVVISSHNRHHLHFFVEAGLRNVAWLPNAEADCPTRYEPPEPSASPWIAASGQLGRYHPARVAIFQELARTGLPVSHKAGSASILQEHYREAQLAINCSLNGDINLRIAEILAAGGCLLTDRLSPQSGLSLLLEDGTEVVSYADAADASVKARGLLADAARSRSVARRGWERMVFDLSFAAQRRRLFDLLAHDRVVERFDIRRDLRCAIADMAAEGMSSTVPLSDRLAFYEHCQECNRTAQRTAIGLSSDVDPVMALDLIDLHRSRVTMVEGQGSQALRHLKRFHEIKGQIEFIGAREFANRDFDIVAQGASKSSDPPKRARRAHAPAAVWVPSAEALGDGFSGYTPSETNRHLLLRCAT